MKHHPASDHATYLSKWQLSAPEPLADTPTSVVWKVKQQNGDPAVLKLLKPLGLLQEVHGADFLQRQQGLGCARLLARDKTVFLIEYISDYTLRDHLIATSDREATEIVCQVIERIHSDATLVPLTKLPSLEVYCEALLVRAKTDAKPEPTGLIAKAAGVLSDLVQQQQGVRALHGDIHHRNILLSDNRGWLAIDPGSLLADPAFEVATVFFNPDGHQQLVEDPARVRYLAETFSALLGRSVTTILQYAFVYACLSACWAEEDGRDANSRLATAAIIDQML